MIENRGKINQSIIGLTGYNPRINADGLFAEEIRAPGYRSHSQFFRNGIREQVTNSVFDYKENYEEERREFFLVDHFIDIFKSSLEIQIKNFKNLDMVDPFYIFISMVGARGIIGAPKRYYNYRPQQSIDDEVIEVPEVLVDSKTHVENAVSSVQDFLWNISDCVRTYNPRTHIECYLDMVPGKSFRASAYNPRTHIECDGECRTAIVFSPPYFNPRTHEECDKRSGHHPWSR